MHHWVREEDITGPPNRQRHVLVLGSPLAAEIARPEECVGNSVEEEQQHRDKLLEKSGYTLKRASSTAEASLMNTMRASMELPACLGAGDSAFRNTMNRCWNIKGEDRQDAH